MSFSAIAFCSGVVIEYGRAVLGSYVSLAVERGGVVHCEENLEDLFVTDDRGWRIICAASECPLFLWKTSSYVGLSTVHPFNGFNSLHALMMLNAASVHQKQPPVGLPLQNFCFPSVIESLKSALHI